jgi:hypothetical protein
LTKEDEKIGEKSCLKSCQDCGKFFHYLEFDKLCEDCFEKGLHKDMNDHWDNYWKNEMKQDKQSCEEKMILDELSERQINIIKHAYGFNTRNPGFRNHYCYLLNSVDVKILIEKGFMIGPFDIGFVGEGLGIFYLTDKAKLELKKIKTEIV